MSFIPTPQGKLAIIYKTNRNPHKREYYEIGGLKIWAVNFQSAQAQHDRIRAHQAMRLNKSSIKQHLNS